MSCGRVVVGGAILSSIGWSGVLGYTVNRHTVRTIFIIHAIIACRFERSPGLVVQQAPQKGEFSLNNVRKASLVFTITFRKQLCTFRKTFQKALSFWNFPKINFRKLKATFRKIVIYYAIFSTKRSLVFGNSFRKQLLFGRRFGKP